MATNTTNQHTMNTPVVYKYRHTYGIVEYEVINGEFGVDSTLHLRDTSCTHPGAKCEIEVVKRDNDDCYQYSRPLNNSAEEYDYFHKLEKFWATKENAYVEGLQNSADSYQKDIMDAEKRIVKNNEALKGLQEKEVNYFNITLAKLDSYCYVEDEGTCRIIGSIKFNDGTTGYLTDGNYYHGSDWDNYDGDRIILIEKESGRLVTERGDNVFLTRDDYDNLQEIKKIDKLTEEIARYQKAIGRWIEKIERINAIIKESRHLTIEQMMEMYNTIKL